MTVQRPILVLLLSAIAWANPASPGRATETPLPAPGFEVDRSRSDPARPARAFAQAYTGPIFDAHVHLDPPRSGRIDDDALRKILNVVGEMGVSQIIFMPTPNEGRSEHHEVGVRQRQRLRDMGGGRVKVFCGGNYLTYWLHRAHAQGYSQSELNGLLGRLADDLGGGRCAGVGEIGLYHFTKWGRQAVIAFPPNFDPFLKVVGVAAWKSAWFDIHAEPVDPHGKSYEDQVFGGLALLTGRFPDLKIILSHTAMTSPANARRILKTYPTVMMNFKIILDHRKWRNLEPVTNAEGELYEDWALLMEAMPDRFMVGTDAKFGRKRYKRSRYQKEIAIYRRLLGSLDPAAAHMIAFANAHRVFGP